MAVNISGLIGIIFFYTIISAIGLIMTYKKQWLVMLWDLIRCKKIKSTENDQNKSDKNNDEINNQTQSNRVDFPVRSLGLLIGSFTLTGIYI